MQNIRNILITGGAGFIGSNFIEYFLNQYTQYRIINLDLLTYSGNLVNLEEVENHPRYFFVQGDISNKELITHLFKEYDIRGVIHFAAESHVDNSIQNPEIFFKTNVCGTQTLVHVAYCYWMRKAFAFRTGYELCRFHHVSTDEVYGSLHESGYFTEETPHAPNSPYSASKSASDFVVRAYHRTYGMNTVVSNCSNNYGPKQHNEKFIPTVIRKALAEDQIPIYGDGKYIRDWLYVADHCQAIDVIFHHGKNGEVYNVGGQCEKENIEVAKEICQLLDNLKPRAKGGYQELLTSVTDRPGHDRHYAIDFSKLKISCGWYPKHTFEQGIYKTVLWYLRELRI